MSRAVFDTSKVSSQVMLGDNEDSGNRSRAIVCVNELPVQLVKLEDGNWEAAFDREFCLEPVYVGLRNLEHTDVLYVGVPHVFVPPSERAQVEVVLHSINCFPVWCDRKVAHNHFQGYCRGILWPTFHNIIDLYSQHRPTEMLTNCGAVDAENDESSQDWETSKSWNPMQAENCWPDYCAMNGLFARKVVELYCLNDVVWVHDYHLLLLPNYLLRKLPNACCGLFLHTPFPSSEIFRTLAAREEILRAMLCASHIGFVLYEYARHFLTCCSRMLGYEQGSKKGGVLYVEAQSRQVIITCAHPGIDAEIIEKELEDPSMQSLASRVAHSKRILPSSSGSFCSGNSIGSESNGQERFESDIRLLEARKQTIVSVDRVEGLRGISLKLLALDRLFTDYSHLRNTVVLKQIGLNMASRPDDYKSCHDEVVALVKLLVDKWGPVVQYEEYTSIRLAERLAIFQNSDVLLCTALRAANETYPFEYLMARRNPAGCMVMSEFTAASRVLHGSLRVNPFKTAAVAATLEEALTMRLSERTARAARDLDFIYRNPLLDWAHSMISDIVASHSDAVEPLTKYGSVFDTHVVPMFDQGKQVDLCDADPPFVESFAAATRRLLLVDYSGTLVETTPLNLYLKTGGQARSWHYAMGSGRRPGGSLETRDPISDEARTALADLCRDPKNVVVVLSDDLREEVDHALEGIRNLARIAENGFSFRVDVSDSKWIQTVKFNKLDSSPCLESASSQDLCSKEEKKVSTASDPWSELDDFPFDDSAEWQNSIEEIMNRYSTRTNGAFVWKSPAAVTFNYALADPDIGVKQAFNLSLELEQFVGEMRLSIDQGKGFVAVRMRGVNRGMAVRKLIKYLGIDFDFVACFGDDQEDESCFAVANGYGSENATSNLKPVTYSVRVKGQADSIASYKVHDSTEVVEILCKLARVSREASNMRRNMSMTDFSGSYGDNDNGPSIYKLGNFRTKQSYVALSSQEKHSDHIRNPNPPTANGKAVPRSSTMSAISKNAQIDSARLKGNECKFEPSHVASPEMISKLFGPDYEARVLTMQTGKNQLVQRFSSSLSELDDSKENQHERFQGDDASNSKYRDEESNSFQRNSGGDMEFEFRKAMLVGQHQSRGKNAASSNIAPIASFEESDSLEKTVTLDRQSTKLLVAVFMGGMVGASIMAAFRKR